MDERSAGGGEPVCWLERVCPQCGLLRDGDPAGPCPRCAAPAPQEERA